MASCFAAQWLQSVHVSVPLLEMRLDGTTDALTTVYADGMPVTANASGSQALEIPHNTSVCAE